MNCPFYGVASDTPHETQEACIEALNSEITRIRALLDQARSPDVPGAPDAPAAGADGEDDPD